MSNRQERNARKLAARQGDTDKQFFHEVKKPTQPYATKREAQAERSMLDRVWRKALDQMRTAALRGEKVSEE